MDNQNNEIADCLLKMLQFRGYSRICRFSGLFLELLKQMKRKLTVGLEPTTAGLEVQRAIQLRHASCWCGGKFIRHIPEKMGWLK